MADFNGAEWLNMTEEQRRLAKFDAELLSVETGYSVDTVRGAVAALGGEKAAQVLRLANTWSVSEAALIRAILMEEK